MDKRTLKENKEKSMSEKHYMFSFSHRTLDIWNSLNDEFEKVKSVQKFKEKLDNIQYGDRSL